MKKIFLSIFSILILASCSSNKTEKHRFNNPSLPTEERVADLLSHLTLEEKAGFLSGETMWYLQEIPRLGIPKIQVTDCGHGVTVILDSLGNYSGSEVVQVYVHDVESTIYKPKKELKGFQKVSLNPNETKQLLIELDAYASYYDEISEEWVLEPGDFEILVGNSSRDIFLKQQIEIK